MANWRESWWAEAATEALRVILLAVLIIVIVSVALHRDTTQEDLVEKAQIEDLRRFREWYDREPLEHRYKRTANELYNENEAEINAIWDGLPEGVNLLDAVNIWVQRRSRDKAL